MALLLLVFVIVPMAHNARLPAVAPDAGVTTGVSNVVIGTLKLNAGEAL